MRSVQVVSLDGPAGVRVVEAPAPTRARRRGAGRGARARHELARPAAQPGRVPAQARGALPARRGLRGRGARAPDGDSGLAAGDRVAGCLPYGGGADLVSTSRGVALPAAGRRELREGRRAADELPDRAVRPRDARAAAAGRDGAGERGRGRRRHRLPPGRQGVRRPHDRRGLHRRRRPTSCARSAPTRRCWSTASWPRSRSSPTGRGVDVLVDVVGGDLMTDSLRSLGPLGRLLVVGFTGGTIPQVKVNRLLLNNTDVRGVGWGAYAMVAAGLHARAVGRAAADAGVRRGRPAGGHDVPGRGGRRGRWATWSSGRCSARRCSPSLTSSRLPPGRAGPSA